MPPVLLTLEGATFPGLDAILAQEPIRHRLVRPPECEGVCELFIPFLQQRGKFWPVSTVAGSTALVPALLTAPDMVGLSVGVKALELPGIVRRPLPLPNLHVGAMWRGQASPLLKGIMDLIAQVAPGFQAILHAGQEPPRAQIKNGTKLRAAQRSTPAKSATRAPVMK